MAVQVTIFANRRPTTNGGFTLVELASILVIAGVLAATAAPTLRSLANTRATTAAKQLLHDMTLARHRAMATGSRTWVVFDLSAQSWSIRMEDPTNPGRTNAIAVVDPATNRPSGQTLGTGSYPGVAIEIADFDGDVELGFDWLGRPLSAAEAMLVASGATTLTGGHTVAVAVSTGHTTYVGP